MSGDHLAQPESQSFAPTRQGAFLKDISIDIVMTSMSPIRLMAMTNK
jgi:hypothetical protein